MIPKNNRKKTQDKDVNKDYHKITQGIRKSFPKAKKSPKAMNNFVY